MTAPRLALLLLIASLLVLDRRLVYACSGPPTTLEHLLLTSDHLIHGRRSRSDLADQNHLVQVEQYLTGGPGPEFILMTQNSPEVLQGLQEYLYGNGDCHGFARRLPPDSSFYVFVSRDADGYYHQDGRLFSDEFYAFPNPGSTVTVYLQNPDHPDDPEDFIGRDVTEAEFLALIAERAPGRTISEAASPDHSAPNPTFAPLLIETKSGALYILPVDGGAPFQVDETELALRLTGYSHRNNLGIFHEFDCLFELTCTAEITAGGVVRLLVENEPGPFLSPFNRPVYSDLGFGDEALFAQNGAAAVWHKDQLQINADPPIPLSDGAAVYGPDYSRWSADGRLFAFSDSAGLWLYDTAVAQARLLIETENSTIPTARAFSTSGRYLLIEMQPARKIVDLSSGSQFAGDAISPDEQHILENRTGTLILHKIPGAGRIVVAENTVDAVWVDSGHFAAVICPPEDVCRVEYHTLEDGSARDILYTESGFVVKVSDYGDVAVQVDPTAISVNRRVVRGVFDAPIQDFRWLPSRFYEQAAADQ